MAKWLEASASVSSPVSGDFATTANFALVVSGVPTSGEKTNASGASGGERVDAGRAELGQQPRAEADAAEVVAQDLLGQRQDLGRAGADVDDERPAEAPAGDAVSHRRPPTGRRRRRPRPAAARRRARSGRR
jgi:hypothetical protein